jgi:predicted nucleic acid-binding protein
MIYAFVDSNIFIRVLSQGKPGCELQEFENLCALARNGVFRLLVPDVVLYELDRQMQELPEKLRNSFGELKSSVNRTSVWSEITDAKNNVLDHIDALRQAKEAKWHEHLRMVDKFLRSDKVTRLPFTPEIMCRARISLMRVGKPSKDQDAAIIESLSAFFEGCKEERTVLLFCSENHTDFAVELRTGQDRTRKFILDPRIAKSLPESYYFLQLSDLLAVDKGYESLPRPPKDVELVQVEEKFRDLDPADLMEAPEYLAALHRAQSLEEKHLSQQFAAEIQPQLLEEFLHRRAKACEHIESMLRQCRACNSWDNDRRGGQSELPQWLEYVPENMIRFTTLANILRIEANVERYLQIHREMDVANQS